MFKRLSILLAVLLLAVTMGHGAAFAKGETNDQAVETEEEFIWPDWYTVAAKTIGISEEDLWAATDEGQSIAAVAQAHGVAPQTVIDALLAADKEAVASAVAQGEITQADADTWLADSATYAKDFVEYA